MNTLEDIIHDITALMGTRTSALLMHIPARRLHKVFEETLETTLKEDGFVPDHLLDEAVNGILAEFERKPLTEHLECCIPRPCWKIEFISNIAVEICHNSTAYLSLFSESPNPVLREAAMRIRALYDEPVTGELSETTTQYILAYTLSEKTIEELEEIKNTTTEAHIRRMAYLCIQYQQKQNITVKGAYQTTLLN